MSVHPPKSDAIVSVARCRQAVATSDGKALAVRRSLIARWCIKPIKLEESRIWQVMCAAPGSTTAGRGVDH
jgi:hypothetical protein